MYDALQDHKLTLFIYKKLSTTNKDSEHYHSKFDQNMWRVELRLKIGHF
jgi:hypothetical protein